MSAEASAAPADNGPTIITVPGQDGYVAPTTPVAVETKSVVEEEVEVPEVKKEAAGSEEQVELENREEKPRQKPGVHARIDELTRARREAERQAEHWKNVAEGKIAPVKAAEVPQPPERDKFETEEAYQDALVDHKVDAKLAAREQANQQAGVQQAKASDWQSKLASARVDIPDFDAVMNSAELPVSPHVADLVMEHDQGAKVVHHLAVNPEELERINAMSPARAAFAIAEIAGKFKAPDASASSSEPVAVVKKVISEAPPPAARTVGSGRSTTVPLGEQSMEDYIATRKSQGASWAR